MVGSKAGSGNRGAGVLGELACHNSQGKYLADGLEDRHRDLHVLARGESRMITVGARGVVPMGRFAACPLITAAMFSAGRSG